MKLAVVAGEASGDLHAADVLKELKKLDPALQSFGIGGDSMIVATDIPSGARDLLCHSYACASRGLSRSLASLGMTGK